jgi:hypothetical protein
MNRFIKIVLIFFPAYLLTIALAVAGHVAWIQSLQSDPKTLPPYLMLFGYIMLGGVFITSIIYAITSKKDTWIFWGVVVSIISTVITLPICCLISAGVHNNLFNFTDMMYMFGLISIYILVFIITIYSVMWFYYGGYGSYSSIFMCSAMACAIIATSLLIFGYHFYDLPTIATGYVFLVATVLSVLLLIYFCYSYSDDK